MKLLSKNSLIAGISIITIAGGMVKYSDANNGEHVDINSKLKTSYLNMVQDNSKIEYMKEIFSDGGYVESYRDKSNKREQVDIYNSQGVLLSRDIVTNKGSDIITIGLDENNEYTAISWDITDSIAQYNESILGTSIIQTSLTEESIVNLDCSWNKIEVLKSGISKISSAQGNIYLDENKEIIEKIEKIENRRVTQSVEYDVLDDNGTLFKVDSPIKGVDTKSNPLTNIYIHQNDTVPGTKGDTPYNSKG